MVVMVRMMVVVVFFLQDAELEARQPLKQVPIEVILEAQRQQQEERKQDKKKKENILRFRGINPSEHNEDTFSWIILLPVVKRYCAYY